MGRYAPPRFVGIVGVIFGLIVGVTVGGFALVLILQHGSEDYGSGVAGIIAVWVVAVLVMTVAGVRLARRVIRR